MLNIIKKYISWLYKKYTPTNTTKQILSDDYLGAIAFKLTKNNDIDVLYALPDIANRSPDEILDDAEQYAKFLMMINQGYLQQNIIDIFQKNIKPDSDAKEHLLLDNILISWKLAEIEEEKRLNRQIKKQQPLIRPSVVFSQDIN